MAILKLVIADDHTLFREGLQRILSMEKDILVVGEADSGDAAVRVAERTKPDVLLLDLKMPGGDAMPVLRKIHEASPKTKILILTAYSDDEDVLDAAKRQARGYVLKGVSTPTLLQAIKNVHAGEVWVDPELRAGAAFKRIVESQVFNPGPPANESLKTLTAREMEILQWVAKGLSNDEIGKKIFISEKTVKTHLTNIFDKLQVNNRFKAALFVMQSPGQSDS